jgi:hypothetical protein
MGRQASASVVAMLCKVRLVFYILLLGSYWQRQDYENSALPHLTSMHFCVRGFERQNVQALYY